MKLSDSILRSYLDSHIGGSKYISCSVYQSGFGCDAVSLVVQGYKCELLLRSDEHIEVTDSGGIYLFETYTSAGVLENISRICKYFLSKDKMFVEKCGILIRVDGSQGWHSNEMAFPSNYPVSYYSDAIIGHFVQVRAGIHPTPQTYLFDSDNSELYMKKLLFPSEIVYVLPYNDKTSRFKELDGKKEISRFLKSLI